MSTIKLQKGNIQATVNHLAGSRYQIIIERVELIEEVRFCGNIDQAVDESRKLIEKEATK